VTAGGAVPGDGTHDDAAAWRSHAQQAWDALVRASFRARRGRTVVREPGGLRAVPLWPFSQVLHTAALVGAPESAGLLVALETYRRGTAYSERPGNRRRYYDDNAWIGLALLDHGDLDGAARVLGFLREGCVPRPDGAVGVRWVEGGEALHACSTGSTGLVALRLARARGSDAVGLHELAAGCTEFLESLLDGDGLVADHLRPDGTVDPGVYTYNQGLLVGLLTGLDRADDAVALADRVRAAFDAERLWRHAPAFDAILVRELLRLDDVRPDAGLRAWCTAYLARVLDEARDPRTGLLTGGGIGRYDDGVVLDHAALAGAMAALGGPATG
jgi:hypothetical protein